MEFVVKPNHQTTATIRRVSASIDWRAKWIVSNGVCQFCHCFLGKFPGREIASSEFQPGQ